MGVPKFFRWLSERYPKINQLLSEDTARPDIDHFYIDMNGILHSCTHDNDEDAFSMSINNQLVCDAIDEYLSRCIDEIVQPKKSLFLALDGVAPRAKLNQQRSRRYRVGIERYLIFHSFINFN
jgi:5'-3' exoribonuclease 1